MEDTRYMPHAASLTDMCLSMCVFMRSNDPTGKFSSGTWMTARIWQHYAKQLLSLFCRFFFTLFSSSFFNRNAMQMIISIRKIDKQAITSWLYFIQLFFLYFWLYLELWHHNQFFLLRYTEQKIQKWWWRRRPTMWTWSSESNICTIAMNSLSCVSLRLVERCANTNFYLLLSFTTCIIAYNENS